MALIILGHPYYNNSVANKAIIEELSKSNLDIEIRNLSELYPDFNINVKEEQEALLRHQSIIIQYPLYWYNMPAILKHWIDVVFDYGFAYGSTGYKLEGKNFIASFTVGGPEDQYNVLGDHHFKVYEFTKNLEQTAYFTKMKYIDAVYFNGAAVNENNTLETVIDKAKKQAQKLVELVVANEK
jgi:putative NADPH-quinone reductase